MAVPSWSSGSAVARHLQHGRHQAGDRHLNFYGNRDNLRADEVTTNGRSDLVDQWRKQVRIHWS
jgi:hypothetical protein